MTSLSLHKSEFDKISDVVDAVFHAANREFYASELMGFEYAYNIVESFQNDCPEVMPSAIGAFKELLLLRRIKNGGEKRLHRLLGEYHNLFFSDSDLYQSDISLHVKEHQPDLWVKKNGQMLPCEVKMGSFRKKDVKQLSRYIDFFGAKYGYAIGSSCTVALPRNIEFVQASDMIIKEHLQQSNKIITLPLNTRSYLLAVTFGKRGYTLTDILLRFEQHGCEYEETNKFVFSLIKEHDLQGTMS
jgi:hypothetical protein